VTRRSSAPSSSAKAVARKPSSPVSGSELVVGVLILRTSRLLVAAMQVASFSSQDRKRASVASALRRHDASWSLVERSRRSASSRRVARVAATSAVTRYSSAASSL